MALETIGVLVNIAGDAGGLVQAVQKATSAFHAFKETSSTATRESMPAFKRLQDQIDAVTSHTNVAVRQQKYYEDQQKSFRLAIDQTKSSMALLTKAFEDDNDYGVAPSLERVKAYDRAMNQLSGTLLKQEASLVRVTKGVADQGDKVDAARSRLAKLNVDLGQVKGPENQSKWSQFFDLLKSGAGVYNSLGGILGKVGSIFGGSGKPAFGAQDSMVFDKSASGIKAMGDAASSAGPKFGVMAAAMAAGQIAATALISISTGVVNAISNMAGSVLNLGIQATQAAGRNQELSVVARYMGAQSGHTATEIDSVATSLKKAGATTQAAYDAITQFTRANMDLSKATDLLSVSQGAAIVSGQDSSAVMQQLIYGIITLQPEMLRTSGIIINADDAYTKYAKTLHTSVQALTGEQKQQAFLNETLLQGAKLQGLYAEAMQLPEKQLRSLTGREIPELIALIGVPFQDTFARIITTVREFVKWLTTSISEGGKFYPLMQAIGTAFSKVTETIQELIKVGAGVLSPMIDEWSTKFTDLVSNAGTWGSNLIIEFANGILDGVSAVIDALGYVGQIISYWLAPGSPPRIVPNLDKWGADAMTVYMKGWTTVDLQSFGNISGKLESFVKGMGDSLVGKTSMVPFIQNMRNSIASMVDEVIKTGKVSEAAVTALSGKFGSASKTIHAYVEAALKAAAADTIVAKLQDQLAEVTSKYDEKLKELNIQLAAYNSDTAMADEDAKLKALQRVLTRASTTDAQKEAAQKEINHVLLQRQIRLTEEEKKKATDSIQVKLDAAQKDQAIAHKQLEYQQALMDAQQKNNELVNEQIQLMDQLAKAAEKAAAALKGTGGGGGGVKPVTPITPLNPANMTGTYMPGMQGQNMKSPLAGLQGLIDKVDELKKKWDGLWGEGGALTDAKNNLGAFGTKLLEFKDKFAANASQAVDHLTQEMKDFASEIELDKVSVPIDWKALLHGITKATEDFLLDTPSRIDNWISGFIHLMLAGTAVIQNDWKKAFIELDKAVGHFLLMFGIKKKDIQDMIKNLVEVHLSKVITSLKEFRTKVDDILTVVRTWVGYFKKEFTDELTKVKTFILDVFIKLALKPLHDMIYTIKDSISNTITVFKELRDLVGGGINTTTNNGNPRAAGGPVLAGHSYTVGELGIEKFVPKTDGYIIPNYMLSRPIKDALPASYINSGGNSQIQNIKNSYLTVNSSVSSQGIVADWGRLQVLGA